ncbi:HindIII family type II restriction endonuclease [Erysipelothrix rhusiopathiae]|nr:HindIII family type II restriction endonuclease [Erysipelothrix rhusiopathiae]
MNSYNLFLSKMESITSNQLHSFKEQSLLLKNYVYSLDRNAFLDIVKQIGFIPESIDPSSSLEKMYSKASDIVLSRCFSELGLNSDVLIERSDSADILARSEQHNYTLVADAKTFRMSRTAKNQKDFKISTLSKWRGTDNNYSVLVSPYFQYPSSSSQIYSSALSDNVCLLSWEHISFLLMNNICESPVLSLEEIWNAPSRISRGKHDLSGPKDSHIHIISKLVCARIGRTMGDFEVYLNDCKTSITSRANLEIDVLNQKISKIKELTHQQAIDELLKMSNIEGKKTIVNAFKRKFSE